MEQELEKVLNDTIAQENVTACMNANRQGLCVGSRGEITPQSSGIFVALLEQASQLEPTSNPPVVLLESSKNICLITKHGISGIIVKKHEQ